MNKRILQIFAFVLMAIGINAQITTSSVSGKITDASGMELIGAAVEAVHVPTGSIYGTISNIDGVYNIINMRVGGPYRITASYLGYETKVIEDVFLRLSSGANVNFTMVESGVLVDELVISGKFDPVLNSKRTGASTSLDNSSINALPTISRNINDFTRLTPQSSGTSFAGTGSRFNNYTIDGNIYNNNFGVTGGQFAGGNPISLDAIDQVTVNLAPYDVRFGTFTGASVNAVTRSGSNNIEGSAYFLYRNDQMIGNKSGDFEVPRGDNYNTTIGARLGGPIIKDKLFFFASWEMEDAAIPSFTKRAAREGEVPDGVNISRVPLAQANFVRDELQRLYGYDTGAPDDYNFAAQIQRLNLRLDYNINKNHKAFIRFNRYSQFSDVPTNGNSIRFIQTRYTNTNRFGIENINFRNNNYTNDRLVTSVVGELNSVLSDNISNQFNVGYTAIADPRRGIPGGQQFPFIEVLEPDPSGNLLYYMTMGNELFSVGNLLENNVFNITNNTTIYSGKHTFTAGVNFEYMTFDNAFNPVFNGFYRFIGYDRFVDAVINQNPNIHPDAFAKSFALDGSSTPPTDRTRFGQLGLYIQDEYQLNPDFKLTGGLRVDLPFYPIDLAENELLTAKNKTFTDKDGNEFVPDVRDFPKVNPLFSPRLGFNWDVNGDRTFQLRGGTGIFSGRIPFVWLSNQVNGSGVVRGGLGFEGQAVIDRGIIFNPDVAAYNPENPEATLSNELNLTDRNFTLPQVWRTNIGADYDLGNGLIATVDLMYNRDVSTPVAYNSVLRDPDGTLAGPDQRGFWRNRSSEGLTGYSNDVDFNNIFLLTNASRKADYYSATFQLSKTFNQNWQAMAAYTHSRARNLDADGGSQAVSLWTQTVQSNRNDPELGFAFFDLPHRAIASLSYVTKNTTIGVFYEGSIAGRFSYTYSGNFGDASNRLMYIPNNASELRFEEFTLAGQTITAARQAELLDAYIDQDAYLSANRGSIAERNAAKNPWVNRFDLRILQDLYLIEGNKNRLQLSLDFLNIGNMFNSRWGMPQFPWQRNLLNFRRVDSDNVPVYRLNAIPGTAEIPSETFAYARGNSILNNAWQLQVGVRVIFGD
jgi:hypothetical protein